MTKPKTVSELHRDLCLEHVEEGTFLWLLRARAVSAPHYSFKGFTDLDDALAAHVDGLRVGGEESYSGCEVLSAPEEPGEAFLATVLAIEGDRSDPLEGVIEASIKTPAFQQGVTSAFGWVAAKYLQKKAKELLAASVPFHRRLGIAACAMHRVEPGAALANGLRDPSEIVRARALRAAGELGRQDLSTLCSAAIADDDPECRFWAAWSAVLLGDRNRALEALTTAGRTAGSHQARAFRLSLQAMPSKAAYRVLREIAQDPASLRWVIQGSGIVGDPTYVPWLIGHMTNPLTARLAGESVALITGVDLSASGLEGVKPESAESGPAGNPDEEDEPVDMDPDDDLPWPDAEQVRTWWEQNAHRFQAPARYLMGAPVTREGCVEILKNGYQRQRRTAAHDLCLLEPGARLFNTSAPAWRQQRLLATLT